MNSLRQVRGLSQAEAELISAGNDRLLAKRAERARLKAEGKLEGGGHSPTPIKAAGELVNGALRAIPVACVKDAAGRWMPFADAVDIVDVISVTGEPGHRRIKLKIRDNEAGRAWAGIL